MNHLFLPQSTLVIIATFLSLGLKVYFVPFEDVLPLYYNYVYNSKINRPKIELENSDTEMTNDAIGPWVSPVVFTRKFIQLGRLKDSI